MSVHSIEFACDSCQCVFLNDFSYIHCFLAVSNARKTKGLSRVNAPTAPNCKKGPMACKDDNMHQIHTIMYTQTNKSHVKNYNNRSSQRDPNCTRSERGTVGHSCFHLRLIPASPNAMNVTPKNKKICEENKKYETKQLE